MSTRIGGAGPAKKMSSWVRPGVCEVRASAFLPVSALIRLDLPTLERPANAISMPRMGGSAAMVLAAAMKRQSPANSLRPRSISSSVNCRVGKGAGTACPFGKVSRAPCPRQESGRTVQERVGTALFLILILSPILLGEEAVDLVPRLLDVVEQLDLGAVLAHDHRLLDHREGVVPGPVDHKPSREARQHEGEDHRHPVEDH